MLPRFLGNKLETFEPQVFYTSRFGGAAPSDWASWNEKGLWPSAFFHQPPSAFSIEHCHGLIYRLLARFAPFNRTLDIGCSAGDFILPIKKLSNESFGVDIVSFSAAWEILNTKYGIKCTKHNIDQQNLLFPSGHFSAVTMVMALEHVFDVGHAASEIARVLEPDGIAIVQVPNIASIRRRLELLFGKLPITADTSDHDFGDAWDGQHLHYFTRATLERLFTQVGLSPQGCYCFGRFGKWRSLWPSLLGGDLTLVVRKPAK